MILGSFLYCLYQDYNITKGTNYMQAILKIPDYTLKGFCKGTGWKWPHLTTQRSQLSTVLRICNVAIIGVPNECWLPVVIISTCGMAPGIGSHLPNHWSLSPNQHSLGLFWMPGSCWPNNSDGEWVHKGMGCICFKFWILDILLGETDSDFHVCFHCSKSWWISYRGHWCVSWQNQVRKGRHSASRQLQMFPGVPWIDTNGILVVFWHVKHKCNNYFGILDEVFMLIVDVYSFHF